MLQCKHKFIAKQLKFFFLIIKKKMLRSIIVKRLVNTRLSIVRPTTNKSIRAPNIRQFNGNKYIRKYTTNKIEDSLILPQINKNKEEMDWCAFMIFAPIVIFCIGGLWLIFVIVPLSIIILIITGMYQDFKKSREH